MKSERNKTIELSTDDRLELSPTLMKLDRSVSLSDIVDRTICQDLFNAIAYLPKHFADLIVIDPPYNLTKDFNGLKHKATEEESYLEYIESWMPKVIECLKSNGSIYVCCDWRSSSAIYEVLGKYSHIRNRITWQREKGRGAKTNWKNSMEDIWYATVSKNDFYFDVESVMQRRRVIAPYRQNGVPKGWTETSEGNFRDTYPSNFWDDITIPFWSMPENTCHPTQKPEKLIAKLILASCPVGGVVFDPFLGSGTTSVVAKKLYRHFCGVEINEEYALLASKRLALAEEDNSIQGYSDGVFWERNTLREQLRRTSGCKQNREKSSHNSESRHTKPGGIQQAGLFSERIPR